jgi:acid phosphatase family membrane protein YuiD
MVAITSVVGFNQGIKSVVFGISASITAIILYDSIGVRRTTGEQTDAILELSEDRNKHFKTKIHVSRGHDYLEVVVGCIVGFVVGYVLNNII